MPETQAVADPVDAWLAELAGREEADRSGTASAADLIACLEAVGGPGSRAEPIIPAVARFIDHPGEVVVPEETIDWDWTTVESCKEVRPARVALVSTAAFAMLRQIGPSALPRLAEVCRSSNPHLRRVAINVMNRDRMTPVARRVEGLARAESAKPDCASRGEAADAVCRSRLRAEPTAAAAVALIGDPVADVALAALDLTYNSWVSLLDAGSQRAAGAEFRAALIAWFGDPDPRIPPKAAAALKNHHIASLASNRPYGDCGSMPTRPSAGRPVTSSASTIFWDCRRPAAPRGRNAARDSNPLRPGGRQGPHVEQAQCSSASTHGRGGDAGGVPGHRQAHLANE